MPPSPPRLQMLEFPRGSLTQCSAFNGLEAALPHETFYLVHINTHTYTHPGTHDLRLFGLSASDERLVFDVNTSLIAELLYCFHGDGLLVGKFKLVRCATQAQFSNMFYITFQPTRTIIQMHSEWKEYAINKPLSSSASEKISKTRNEKRRGV